MKFSKKAKEAIKIISKTRDNVFITGKAGTGKSTLLDHIRRKVKKNLIVLAPTGISAINVNGETIHSFFTLKPGFERDEAEKMRIDDKKKKKFSRIKTIAIDEISMVRADLLDAIDIVLRRARGDGRPFGGVQMIFFGDLYQLPPVVTSRDRDKFFADYDSPYFFNAKIFLGANDLFSGEFELRVIELDEIYRQDDTKFIEILNAVREKSVTNEHLDILNTRHLPNFLPRKKDKYIYLMTTNASAARINMSRLNELSADEIVFHAEKEGQVARNLYPNDEKISVKIGAQVMFISNDQERRWVNGTIGKVIDIKWVYNSEKDVEETVVIVKKTDGIKVEVKQQTWEISKYVFEKGEFKREMLGSYTQIPLKLAWAMTIHKSQGKTFEKVILDLEGGSFAHGQTYVALSRCTSLEGLILKKRMYRSSIIMDQRVKNFQS